MENFGNCGRSSRHYETGAVPSVLAGILTTDEAKTYPSNYCDKCIAAGVTESETCFHRHWMTKKERKEAQ
jgi:hypothetical protein